MFKVELASFKVTFRKNRVGDCKSNAGGTLCKKNLKKRKACDIIIYPPLFNVE